MGIYFDHNATTPLDPEVLDAMLPFLKETFGNPSSIHQFGQAARRGLDRAREQVATLIGADPEEIVFTSGGTEADNLAVFGTVEASPLDVPHVVTSAVEHQAVYGPVKAIEAKGGRATYLGVSGAGAIAPEEAADAVADDTALITLMLANNDVGALQPIREVAALTRERGVLLHTDAVQAAGKIPVDVEDLGVDLLSLSSHKIYGPKGMGALFVRRGTRVAPLMLGGHQESRRRAGTENLPAVVGFGKACELARARLAADAERIRALRDRLEAGITARVGGAVVIGREGARLPGTSSIAFPGVEGDALLMALDLKGVAVSTGSACTSDSKSPSHVLSAMGVLDGLARGAIRFSLGRGNIAEEVDRVVDLAADMADRLKNG
jgi:cysteine desulfurase